MKAERLRKMVEMLMNKPPKESIWLAEVEYIPTKYAIDFPTDAKGASTNILAKACSRNSYLQKVIDDLNADGFEIINVEDIRKYNKEMESEMYEACIIQAARDIDLESPVTYGTVYVYYEE